MNVAKELSHLFFGESDFDKLNLAMRVAELEKQNKALKESLKQEQDEISFQREAMTAWNNEAKEMKELIKALEAKVQKLADWSEYVGSVIDKHVDRIQALEIKHEEIKGRTLGWQEGFGDEIRNQLRRMDERIAKLLESDDSADFEIGQWIEEMKALRKDVKALEKRVEAVENIKPILVPVRDQQSDRTPVLPSYQPPIQPTRTWPGTDPLNPPYKITCQKEIQ